MKARALLKGSAVIAVALGLTQVMAYILSVTAAKTLLADAFGSFGALLNLVLIGTVLALGLQAVAARSVVTAGSRSGGDAGGIGARVLRFGVVSGTLLGVVGIAVSPLLTHWLGLPGPWPALLAVLMLPPLTVAGAQYGIAQGHERYALLSALLIVNGLFRYVAGMAGLLGTNSVTGTIAAMAIGTWLGAAVGWLLVRRLVARDAAEMPDLRTQVVHATHALLALYVATSIDVILARAFLTPTESGEYAVGALVTKVALWLPYFVGVVAFPRMAAEAGRRTAVVAAGAVILIGAVVVGGLVLAPELVLDLVAGPQYDDIAGFLWVFGLIGAAFALAQLLLYSRLAVNDRRAVVALWAAVVLIVVGVGVWHDSVEQVAVVVATVAVLLCAVGVGALVADQLATKTRSRARVTADTTPDSLT